MLAWDKNWIRFLRAAPAHREKGVEEALVGLIAAYFAKEGVEEIFVEPVDAL